MNMLIVIMIAAGCLLAVFAIVGIWEKRDKRRLLNIAMKVAETDREPENIFWGNNCLILFYIRENFIITALDSEARLIPISSIVDSNCTLNSTGTGTGRITMTLNDPLNPDISLVFPGNEAAHVHSVISSFMAQSPVPVPVIAEVPEDSSVADEEVENLTDYRDEKTYSENVINGSSNEKYIILEEPRKHTKEGNVIIDNF